MGEAAYLFQPLSIEEYLRTEEASSVRREYVYGQLYAQAGASENHNRISLGIASKLLGAAAGCRVYMAEMKLRIGDSRFYYPDVMVVCDPEDKHKYYRTTPCLLFEVLSASTAGTDRREKLITYKELPSLQAYILVDSEQRLVEMHRRDETGAWWFHQYRGQGTLKLPCPLHPLTLSEIYEGLEVPDFPPTID